MIHVVQLTMNSKYIWMKVLVTSHFALKHVKGTLLIKTFNPCCVIFTERDRSNSFSKGLKFYVAICSVVINFVE